MTTNDDFTFTPHDSPETIQGRWNVGLVHLSDEGENQAITTRLRSVWKDNWWKYPDNIKESFLRAAGKSALKQTKRVSGHALYKSVVTRNLYDLDWGVWLVLRVIYYDVFEHTLTASAFTSRQNFERAEITSKIMGRYQGANVLEDTVPPTFPPRPDFWPAVGNSGTRSGTASETPALSYSASNQTSSENYGADAVSQTADDEGNGSPSHTDSMEVIKKEAPEHAPMSNQRDDSSGLDTNTAGDGRIRHSPQTQASQKDNSIIGNPGSTLSNGKNVSTQDTANESDHQGEKAAHPSNESNTSLDWSRNVTKSLRSRSMSEDEEEDAPSRETLRSQKRRRVPGGQSQSSEPEATSNSRLHVGLRPESLEHIQETIEKRTKESLTEHINQLVTQQVEADLKPFLHEEFTHFVSQRLLGGLEASELPGIPQQIVDTMIKHTGPRIQRQIIQQITSQLAIEMQPLVGKMIINAMARHLLEKFFGGNSNSEH